MQLPRRRCGKLLLILDLCTRWGEWSASRPAALYPPGKDCRYLWIGSWVVLRAGVVTSEKLHTFYIYVQSRFVDPGWPRSLRLRSAATWLLRLWVRILMSEWMFVSSVYMLFCLVYVEVSATGSSLVQRSRTMCLIVCDKETSIKSRTRLNMGCSAIGK
jgi:hypothetical protein